MKIPALFTSILALVFAGTSPTSAAPDEKGDTPWIWRGQTIAEFDEGEYKGPDWKIVNDGVMGGLSKGKVQISKEGIMKFSGDLSLENNGGFSLVESEGVDLNLSNDLGVLLLVKGDGREYQLRFESDAKFRGMPVSFSGTFQTKKGEWEQVKVPFTAFKGGWRGRDLPEEKLNPASIDSIGIIIADKKQAPFALEVDWIRTYGKDQGSYTEQKKAPAAEDKKPAGPKSLIATAVADGRFTTLKAALDAAGLTPFFQWDNKLTVFAPTDEAFAKLPKGTVEDLLKPENKEQLISVLKLHVHPGSKSLSAALNGGEVETIEGTPLKVTFSEGRVRVNDATILIADIECADGTIHAIDTVLLPEPKKKTLLSTAQKAGSFTTLLAAAKAAGLVDALTGDEPLTVFAPTDEAFAALPAGTVESLLKKENSKKLLELLTSHVVAGSVSSGDALNAGSAKSLSGSSLEFGIKDGLFTVNDSVIRSAGIDGGNGTIHVISSVIGFPETGTCDSEKCEKPCNEGSSEKAPAESPAKGQKTTSANSISAADMILAAIERGVPLYNTGNIDACADVYETCLITLSQSKPIGERTREMLSKVTEAGQKKDSDSRAWLYRSALDHMLKIISTQS